MSDPPRSHQISPDAPGYVAAWARDLLAAVGKREARRLVADYKAIAANRRLAKADRDIAAERAKALASLV